MRSSISAMQRTAAKIYKERSLLTVQEEIASIEEVFRLQDVAELKMAERKYLPANGAGYAGSAGGGLQDDTLGSFARAAHRLIERVWSEAITSDSLHNS
jgi:hypothetical protein